MEAIDNKIIRNEAGVAALAFGAVSGGCTFLDPVLTQHNIVWLSEIIAVAKLAGLIWLMVALMKRLRSRYDGVGRKELRSYGTWIALFSALITAACSYISVAYVFPSLYAETIDGLWKSMSSMLDSNSASMVEWYENNFAMISMISTFIWCWLYGWVLSCIVAPRVSPSSIFDEEKKSDDEDDD